MYDGHAWQSQGVEGDKILVWPFITPCSQRNRFARGSSPWRIPFEKTWHLNEVRTGENARNNSHCYILNLFSLTFVRATGTFDGSGILNYGLLNVSPEVIPFFVHSFAAAETIVKRLTGNIEVMNSLRGGISLLLTVLIARCSRASSSTISEAVGRGAREIVRDTWN